MPRFLDTWTGEFVRISDPTTVTYAILSHVWRQPEDGGEQSFDEVCRIQAAVKEDREGRQSPAPYALKPTEYHEEGTIFAHLGLSNKIKGFCQVAREAGFRLAWNDACCIDKTSSAELSEAINSMYEWYRLSDMCYVYLEDVEDGCIPHEPGSMFYRSRWHRRGWTLQELIAPSHLVFLTQTWHLLGTKMGLASTLENITRVDLDILTGKATLDSVSVARKMSWAAQRETTRIEDSAYSLMGIFGVHMSTIYGEGKNAFLRLQEEIIRTVPDQSIFAWGKSGTMWSLGDGFNHVGYGVYDPGLLASSPTFFTHSHDITLVTSFHLATTLGLRNSEDVPPMHCTLTPHGIRMRLLCLPMARAPYGLDASRAPQVSHLCAGCRRLGEVHMMAILQCQDKDGHLIVLPLCRPREEDGNHRGLSIGTRMRPSQCTHYLHGLLRTVRLAKHVLAEVLEHVQPTAVEVLLLRHYSHPPIPKSLHPDTRLARLQSRWHINSVFSIAPHSIDDLRALGFTPSPLRVTRSVGQTTLRTTLTSSNKDSSQTLRPTELCLSLTWLAQDRTKAHFSVNGMGVAGPHPEEFPFAHISADTSRHISINPPHVLTDTTNINHDDGSQTSILRLDTSSRRTITYKEYTVCLGDHCQWEEPGTGACTVRRMRIALTLPFATPADGCIEATGFWLSIEISEEYRYTGKIKSPPKHFWLKQPGDVCEEDTSNDPCAHRISNVALSSTLSQVPILQALPKLGTTMTSVLSEHSRNSSFASTITTPGSPHIGRSISSAQPQHRQKTTLGVEPLKSTHGKRCPLDYGTPSSGMVQSHRLGGHKMHVHSRRVDRSSNQSTGEEIPVLSLSNAAYNAPSQENEDDKLPPSNFTEELGLSEASRHRNGFLEPANIADARHERPDSIDALSLQMADMVARLDALTASLAHISARQGSADKHRTSSAGEDLSPRTPVLTSLKRCLRRFRKRR